MKPALAPALAALGGALLVASLTAAQPRAATPAPAASQSAGSKPPLSYSSAQAWQGNFEYVHNCAYCHAGNLAGFYGPALLGPGSKIPMETAKSVWEYMIGQMPLGNSGGLSQKQYVEIMAYMLQKNGVRAGKNELTAGAVDTVTTPIGQLK